MTGLVILMAMDNQVLEAMIMLLLETPSRRAVSVIDQRAERISERRPFQLMVVSPRLIINIHRVKEEVLLAGPALRRCHAIDSVVFIGNEDLCLSGNVSI